MVKKLNKILLVVLFGVLLFGSSAIVLVLSFDGVRAVGDFAGGSGTASDPYLVSNAREFNNIRANLDKHFRQIDNIDLKEYDSFAMFGSNNYPFSGVYNGDKYIIENFDINMPTTSGVGLFAFNTGTIQNVRIQNAKVQGAESVGALVGVNNGTISGVVVNADVQGRVGVGGVAGYNDSIVGNSVNYGAVRATEYYAGGIAGVNASFIRESYNAGYISADIYLGGIVGLNDGRQKNATIDKVYNIGEVDGRAKGELVGDNLDGWIKYGRWISRLNNVDSAGFNFYPNKTISTKGFSSEEIANKVAFGDWTDWNENWRILPQLNHPILNAEYVEVKQIIFEQSEISLQPEQSTKIEAQVSPRHATIQNIEYSILSGANNASINAIGEITVLPNAKVGDSVTVQAKADGISNNQRINITKIPVQSV